MQRLVSAQEFFGFSGIQTHGNEYTPVSIGKRNKVADSNRTWMKSLRNLDFTSSQELRELAPERVFESPIHYSKSYTDCDGLRQFSEPTLNDNLKAIVGETTQKLYSVKTKMYHIVQHKDIINAFADASDDTGIPVFGKLHDKSGRMNLMVFFADPTAGVKFNDGEEFALGMRVFNSHTGQTAFGGSAMAVRHICSNLMAFGTILGEGKWKHYMDMKNTTLSFKTLIEGYLNNVPVLHDRIEELSNIDLTIDEAECLLYGISITPVNAISMIEHKDGLNPAVKGKESVSLWDLHNVATAFFSHRTAGENMIESGFTGLENIQKLFETKKTDAFIQRGEERRRHYLESLKDQVIDLSNATVVAD